VSGAKNAEPSAGPRRFKPYPGYKDSDVKWLGEIPAHWNSLALSRVTLSRCDGPFGSGLKSEHYSGTGVRVIRLQNIGWAEFLDVDRAYIDEEYARELGDHSVMTNDLLIAGLGDEAHPVGRSCVAPNGIEPAMVKADCFRLRLDRRRAVPRFAAYQLSASASPPPDRSRLAQRERE
jgi:type I restriction enzyme, S subunit